MSNREAMIERVERFCSEYADLLKKAEGLDPLSGTFGKLEGEEMRMIDELVDSLLSIGSRTCDWKVTGVRDLWACSRCGELYESEDAWHFNYCPKCKTKCSKRILRVDEQ